MKNPRLSTMTERSVQSARTIASWYTLAAWKAHPWRWRLALIGSTVLFILLILMFWWSREPAQFDVNQARSRYLSGQTTPVVGSAVVGTTIKELDVLLHKPGGYMLNDIFPPGVLMDNITEWEYGVVINLRETIRTLRYEFSRSQSQSRSVKALEEADNAINRDADKWRTLPSTESSFGDAEKKLIDYGNAIADTAQPRAQFYARADNLAAYLALVSKTLGDLTGELAASVGDTVIEGDVINHDSQQSTPSPAVRVEHTPRLLVDNIFYKARGYSWALLHELEAIRIDFQQILEKKNALASLDQIIAQLRRTQQRVWSPIILNGEGFGILANHSLVMAGYLGRANAGIIDLIQLLRQG